MIYRFGALLAVALLASGSVFAQPYYPPPAPYYQQQQAPYPYPPPPQGQYGTPQYTGQQATYTGQQPYSPPAYAPPAYTAPAAPAPPAPVPVEDQSPQYGDNQNGVQNTGHRLNLDQILAKRKQNGYNGVSTVIRVALGDKDNAVYHDVFPIIQGNMPRNISLIADESVGSYQSATGVCLGIDAAAIVQMDAAQYRATGPQDDIQSDDARGVQSCRQTMKLVGPMFPMIGYWIVAADNPHSSVHDMLTNLPRDQSKSCFMGIGCATRKLQIAVGVEGAGGPVTLHYLLASNKTWHDAIAPHGIVHKTAGEEALAAVESHEVDAYFVMEPLKSHFINDIVNTYDGGGKFKILSINPYDTFFQNVDGKGRLMYQKASMPSGHWYSSDTQTISVDAVLITNVDFANGNADAIRAFEHFTHAALPQIREATNTPADWTPATRLR